MSWLGRVELHRMSPAQQERRLYVLLWSKAETWDGDVAEHDRLDEEIGRLCYGMDKIIQVRAQVRRDMRREMLLQDEYERRAHGTA